MHNTKIINLFQGIGLLILAVIGQLMHMETTVLKFQYAMAYGEHMFLCTSVNFGCAKDGQPTKRH